MASGWTRVRLGDLIEVKHGYAFDGMYFRDEPRGDILFTMGNFKIGGGFQEGRVRYYVGPRPQGFELEPGDLMVTMSDVSRNADALGYPAFVPELPHGFRYLHNQRVGKVVILADGRLDKRFLYYLLCSTSYRNEILASATGTAIRHTAPNRIKNFQFWLPPLSEQRAIAHILGTLDDKIKLNRRMNETLEAMARALFKSWFVDFDPVHAKAEGRQPVGMDAETAALFPVGFEESRLGRVPAGWNIDTLGNVTSYLNRGFQPTYVEIGGVLVVNQKCIRSHRVHFAVARRHDPHARDISGRKLMVGDVLVNSTGVGTLGRVAQLEYLLEPTIADSHVTVIRARADRITANVLGLMLMEREAEIEQLGEGSTGQTELSRERLRELIVLVPPLAVMRQFDKLVGPLRQRATANEREDDVLARIRDTLLPKLLSGEIRVGEAGKVVEEVTA